MSLEELKLKPTIEVWTMQLAQWRKAKKEGIHVLDITAKSGHNQFAPEMALVMDYKAGIMDQETYTDRYLERIDLIKEQRPESWDILEKHPRVAFTCYCRADTFCHRHLFLDVARTHLEEKGYDVIYRGELK